MTAALMATHTTGRRALPVSQRFVESVTQFLQQESVLLIFFFSECKTSKQKRLRDAVPVAQDHTASWSKP